MKSLCYGYSLESPRQGNSNEYSQHIICNQGLKKQFFLWRFKGKANGEQGANHPERLSPRQIEIWEEKFVAFFVRLFTELFKSSIYLKQRQNYVFSMGEVIIKRGANSFWV